MARISILSVGLTLCLISIVTSRTFIDCSCSASKRGYGRNARDELRLSITELRNLEIELKGKQKKDAAITDTIIANLLKKEAIDAWNHCVSNHSYEECANADAALRFSKGKYQPSFCYFNRKTWLNGDKPACDTFPALASIDEDIIAGDPEFESALPPIEPTKPLATLPASDEKTTITDLTPMPEVHVNPVRTPQPGRLLAALPITSVPNVTPPVPEEEIEQDRFDDEEDKERGININNGLLELSTSIEPSASPELDDAMDASKLTSLETPPPSSLNEGCVAIEHLEGYVLQHADHLRRHVLCAHSFCATPNHALIVDGKWTSMKRLCAFETGIWSCAENVKFVNNLKIVANRRAVVNDLIIVTPYDIRFPRFAIWLVQIGEDVISIILAVVLAVLITGFVIVSAIAFNAGK